MIKKRQKKKAAKKMATIKPTCVCCKCVSGELQLNDSDWICEDCAQYMSDIVP